MWGGRRACDGVGVVGGGLVMKGKGIVGRWSGNIVGSEIGIC